MANKITLDFETGIITFDTDYQHGVHQDPDLASKEDAILAAMGYEKFDLSGAFNAVNAYINGQIDEATFHAAMDAEAASKDPVFELNHPLNDMAGIFAKLMGMESPQPCEGGCDECDATQYECDYRYAQGLPDADEALAQKFEAIRKVARGASTEALEGYLKEQMAEDNDDFMMLDCLAAMEELKRRRGELDTPEGRLKWKMTMEYYYPVSLRDDEDLTDPSTGILLTPSWHGESCKGVNECCDECDHYQACFPDWKTTTDSH